MEQTLEEFAETLEEQQSKFYGVVTGKVVDLKDLTGLGRVQVEMSFQDATDVSAWARVATPLSGAMHGMYFIPKLGDEVLCAFEHGDVHAPYIIGSLWNAMAPPPLPTPLAEVRTIRTPIGHEITFADLLGSITIKTATGQTILMSATGIQLIAGANLVDMSATGISITSAGDLTLTAAKSVSITAPKVAISGKVSAELSSMAICKVTGKPVKIN
jgi:uncharacterized protein involved in type VI secretion and phage assembly